MCICRKFGLHRRVPLLHPLFVACLSALPYWVGNSGLIFGRHAGIALWIRNSGLLELSLIPVAKRAIALLSSAGLVSGVVTMGVGGASGALASEVWEEMASFHLFGLLGNEMLWRGYEWLAVAELRVIAAARRSSGCELNSADLADIGGLAGRRSPSAKSSSGGSSQTEGSSSSEPSSSPSHSRSQSPTDGGASFSLKASSEPASRARVPADRSPIDGSSRLVAHAFEGAWLVPLLTEKRHGD